VNLTKQLLVYAIKVSIGVFVKLCADHGAIPKGSLSQLAKEFIVGNARAALEA
jgi:hypothetical protein